MSTNDEEEVNDPTNVQDLQRELEEASTKEQPEPAQNDEEPTKGEESPAEEQSEATLTTEPQESDKDLEWYKKAYDNSTAEALRLKKENDELRLQPPTVAPTSLTPEQLYIRQKQDEEIAEAFSAIQTNYPQVKDKPDYDRFTAMAQTVGKNITEAEKRLPPPKEVYAKTVVLLGWNQAEDQERLGAALKNGAASPGVASSIPSGQSKSRVTDAMISLNRKMYPGKTDAEIREELEPHVQ